MACVGKCEDMIDQYYGKLFHSFAMDSHEHLVKYVENHFKS